MTLWMRINNIFLALLFIFSAIVIILDPESGYILTAFVLMSALFIYSIKEFVYFFSMAQYMVGGKSVLFQAILTLNFALVGGGLALTNPLYIMIYLVVIIAFSGVVDILRALEKRKNGAPYRWKLVTGAGIVIISILGFVFLKHENMVVYLAAANLVVKAISKIAETFRKTAILYIT